MVARQEAKVYHRRRETRKEPPKQKKRRRRREEQKESERETGARVARWTTCAATAVGVLCRSVGHVKSTQSRALSAQIVTECSTLEGLTGRTYICK